MTANERDDWESGVLIEGFAALREASTEPAPDLDLRCLERVEEAITAQDFLELSTVVLVAEFLGPVLDLFAFALGFDEGEPNRE